MILNYNSSLSTEETITQLLLAGGYPQKYLKDLTWVVTPPVASGAGTIVVTFPNATHPCAVAAGATTVNNVTTFTHTYQLVRMNDVVKKALNAPAGGLKYYVNKDTTTPLKNDLVAALPHLKDAKEIDYVETVNKPSATPLDYSTFKMGSSFKIKPAVLPVKNKVVMGEADAEVAMFLDGGKVRTPYSNAYIVFSPYAYLGVDAQLTPFTHLDTPTVKFSTIDNKRVLLMGSFNPFFDVPHIANSAFMRHTTVEERAIIKRTIAANRNQLIKTKTPFTFNFDQGQLEWLEANTNFQGASGLSYVLEYAPPPAIAKNTLVNAKDFVVNEDNMFFGTIEVETLSMGLLTAWRYMQMRDYTRPQVDIQLKRGNATTLPVIIGTTNWKSIKTSYTPLGALVETDNEMIPFTGDTQLQEFYVEILKQFFKGQQYLPKIELVKQAATLNLVTHQYRITPENQDANNFPGAWNELLKGEVIVDFRRILKDALVIEEDLDGFENKRIVDDWSAALAAIPDRLAGFIR